jgi:hypothetical protein
MGNRADAAEISQAWQIEAAEGAPQELGLFPSEECLRPDEAARYLRTKWLPPERLIHMRNCEYCQSVTWESGRSSDAGA